MSELAIRGGQPIRSAPSPVWPIYDKREAEALAKVLESRNWGGYPSPNVFARRFAERFAAFHDARYGIPAANGTVTLKIALRAAGVRAGDEVITTPLTWVANASAALDVNAVPVFADIDTHTYCLDPDAVEAAIGERTRAIVAVHLGCRLTDMDRLMQIAERYGLTVIEDCAHVHGARWRNRGVGSIGHLGSFSFQSSKLMTSGEGGILLTNDHTLNERCHSLVNCGRKETGYEGFEEKLVGWNDRLTEWQAAILDAQLERLEEQTHRREQNAEYLYRLLGEIEGIEPLYRDKRITRTGNYLVILRYNPEAFAGVHRDRFVAALSAEGIDCYGSLYTPLYKHPLLHVTAADYPQIRERYGEVLSQRAVACPRAEHAAYHEAIWLNHPLFLGKPHDMEHVAEAIAKIQRNAAELVD